MNRTPRLSKSAIEYLDHVWNFASGCTKDCAYCWARKIACRFADHYPNGFEPTLYPEAFTSPLRLRKPSTIGVCFMGDLFDDMVDPSYDHVLPSPDWCPTLRMPLRDWILRTIEHCPQHRFLFLTKQPQNLPKWAPFPSNCYVGVSVDSAGAYDPAMAGLAEIEASVKYISFEPLLGDALGCSDIATEEDWSIAHSRLWSTVGINWVVVGAQSGPKVMPELGWVRRIINAADQAGIPVFLKDNLGWPRMTHNGSRPFYRREVGTWVLRQEMPTDG